MGISENQTRFIDFLLRNNAVIFGDFVTKSGRNTPYFVNTGSFQSGSSLSQLGGFYARHISGHFGGQFDVLFGPAYKGIPLATVTATSLNRDFDIDIKVSFNRKEVKDHGDKGNFLCYEPKGGERVIIVEDVITAGTTMREVVPLLRRIGNIEVVSAVVAVDRMERGAGERSAIQEVESDIGIRVSPIVTARDIVSFLEDRGESRDREFAGKIVSYLERYSALY